MKLKVKSREINSALAIDYDPQRSIYLKLMYKGGYYSLLTIKTVDSLLLGETLNL